MIFIVKTVSIFSSEENIDLIFKFVDKNEENIKFRN